MCVFFGFILSESDIYCTDGDWVVASKVGDMPDDAGSPFDEDGAAAGPGGCLAQADQDIMNAAAFDKQSTDCSKPCAFNADVAGCVGRCLVSDVGLSASCARCNAENIACGAKNCLTSCALDSASESCHSCVREHCDVAFQACKAGS